MNYKGKETGTHFFSCSNNLSYGYCFLAFSRSLSEFVAMDWTVVQNVMAVGQQRVAAASTPPAPREPIQLWIVFLKGRQHWFSSTLRKVKAFTSVKHAVKVSMWGSVCTVCVCWESRQRQNHNTQWESEVEGPSTDGGSCVWKASPRKCSKQSNQLSCPDK